VRDAVKRAVDVAGAAAGLAVLWPVILATAVAVRVKLGSPVIFRQERAGRGGRPFVMLKFRTMRDAADAEGRPLPDAERMTPFGTWLRSTSLDELPGLVNVLRGDMSLVGPRPLPMAYLPLYSPEQARRHEVRPGVTGWAAVNGRNALPWDDRLAMDVWYVEHRSFLLDLRILLATVRKVVRREGVSQEGHVTSEVFRGPANRPPQDLSPAERG
jgi:lipopolysaccharide/colanic/teichoic acid biosynthesis glycosyltransferase